MKIKRKNIVDQFSTFLFFSGENNASFIWKTDLVLKKNLEKIIINQNLNPEKIAYNFLSEILIKVDKIKQNHLNSYLQEVCFWSAIKIYNSLYLTLKLLTLEECFLSGNQALIEPEKLLRNYKVNYGNKITTYAQTRLTTIIKDTIYRNRNWKLLTDWGLLTKISKNNREKILKNQGGLTGEKLAEYLLAWQCYCDNYQTANKGKNRKLSEPNLTQLQLMNQQYNLQIKQINNISITADELKQKLKFCTKIARLAVNPITVMYEENQSSLTEENPSHYIDNLAEKKEIKETQQIIINSFNHQEKVNQAILYLAFSLHLTQGEIIKIINQTYPNLIQQQYQLSRKINAIKKAIIDDIIKEKNIAKDKISAKEIKPMICLLDVCLQEYIEDETLILISRCYQNLNSQQKLSLKNEYFQEKTTNPNQKDIVKFDNHVFIDSIRESLAKKLKMIIPNLPKINNQINILIQKFCEQYFNRIN